MLTMIILLLCGFLQTAGPGGVFAVQSNLSGGERDPVEQFGSGGPDDVSWDMGDSQLQTQFENGETDPVAV